MSVMEKKCKIEQQQMSDDKNVILTTAITLLSLRTLVL